MLDPDHAVEVIGQEHHQPALVAYAPDDGGLSRRVAAELCFTAGGRIEVQLDGWRAGELSAPMSQRYGPHVEEILRRGGRPGAVGLIANGPYGYELEVRLPDVSAAPAPIDDPLPLPPARARRRFRTPLLIGGGVFALLVGIAAVFGGADRDASDPLSSAAIPSVPRTSAPPPTPQATTPPVTSAPPVTTEARDQAVVPDRDSDTDRTAAPRRRVDPSPEPAPVQAAAPPVVVESAVAEVDPLTESGAESQTETETGVGSGTGAEVGSGTEAGAGTGTPESQAATAPVYYQNCDAVRAAGAAPIQRGDPGYRSGLDSDGDGEGCAGD